MDLSDGQSMANWSSSELMIYPTGGGVSGRSGVLGFDYATESATSSKLPRDRRMYGAAGFHDVAQNTVDRVFIKDAKVSVCVEIHFQRLQFQALFAGFVSQGDGAEVRKAGLWADGGIFWNFDRDVVAPVLVRKCFDVRQWGGNAALCMPLIVSQHRGPPFLC